MCESNEQAIPNRGPAYEEWHDEVLALVGKDDREARNALYLRHEYLVWRLGGAARRQLRAVEYLGLAGMVLEPEDIDQQAFIVFCDLLESWQPAGEPFMHYMQRLLPGRLRHYVRDTLRYSFAGKPGRTIPLETNDPCDVPLLNRLTSRDNPPAAAEEVAAWQGRVLPLPDPLRKSVELKYLHDLSSATIATVVGRSKRTVNRNLKSALHILRASAEDPWEACD